MSTVTLQFTCPVCKEVSTEKISIIDGDNQKEIKEFSAECWRHQTKEERMATP